MERLKTFLPLILAMHAAGGLQAQSWITYDMANAGFPSNTVVDIAVEADGDAWVATDWGLCRLQAGEWSTYQVSNSGLPDNYLRCLALDQQGRLWVGTSVGGAAVFDGQDWVVYDSGNSPLPDDQVNRIHVDHQGWVWLGTVGGLACFTGSEWRIYDSSPDSHNGRILNGDHILSIDTRSDGLVALGTLNGGFHFLTDTAVQFFTTFNFGFFDNTQNAVLLDTVANERWVACPAGGLVRQIGDWYGGSWFQYTVFNSDLPSNALTDIARDPSGRLWLGTQTAGLARRDPNGTYTVYDESGSGLPANEVNAVTVAPDGSVWVGLFDGGAARLDLTSSVPPAPAPQALRILPTINDGSFRVSGLAAGQARPWRIIDAAGRTVASGAFVGGSDDQEVITGLGPGTYAMLVNGLGNSTIGRFVVH